MVTPSYMYMYGVTGVFCSIEIHFKVITKTLEAIAHVHVLNTNKDKV